MKNISIIGLEGCQSCTIIRDRFPNVKYILVKKQCADDHGCREMKKALGKFNIEHFPVVMNADFTELLPLEILNT
jgi:hypothetical protein